MNDIRYNQAARTFSQVAIAGLFATQMPPAISAESVAAYGKKPLFQGSNYWGSNEATFDDYRSSLTGEYNLIVPDHFEQVVGNFYARLLTGQESLGSEFERVLHENLWGLYES